MPSTSSPAQPKPRALLSVSDKTGLEAFAHRLAACGFELVSTGGTAERLRKSGLEVRDVAEITAFPEMLDGRLKTLHPLVHGGLLGRWDEPGQRAQMQAQAIAPIRVLVVNLYPFEQVAARIQSGHSVPRAELIENIDIGGPAMLRSGAKNYESVAVVTDAADYDAVAGELEAQGAVSAATRWRLAQKAFRRTASYDAAIASLLESLPAGAWNEPVGAAQGSGALPDRLVVNAVKLQGLRYGENPHQRAALYGDAGTAGVAHGRLLQGKELSFNNLVDLDAAWQLALEFAEPAVAIIKHTNPAGCATAPALLEAYQRALACDPVSAYGGVVGLNRELDAACAEALAQLFLECIAAPGFSREALARLAGKKNLRLLEVAAASSAAAVRSISGGWLLQDNDEVLFPADGGWKCVTQRAPTAEEERGLRFAWAVAKHVKSNAIVFGRADGLGGQTLGVGAGQMSRVDSVRIAGLRAQLSLAHSVVASDAFFPFPDGIEEAARLGATAVVQPGGSIHDADCIAACDRLGLAMVFTGMRHFRH